MCRSEDLEKFTSIIKENGFRVGALQTYWSSNNVPYKVIENYSGIIQKKIVDMKVVGRPVEEP